MSAWTIAAAVFGVAVVYILFQIGAILHEIRAGMHRLADGGGRDVDRGTSC